MTISGAFRGGLEVANTLYGAWSGELYTVDDSGNRVLYNTLSGSDKIWIAQNNAATPDIAIVCAAGPFLVSGGSVSAWSAVSGTPSCMCNHIGYFMLGYGNGNIQASGLNATTINSLDIAKAQSNPDGVTDIFSYGGYLYVMGTNSIEVWGDPTNDTGFPLTRIGYNLQPGVLTDHVTSGWEPEFGNAPMYVGSDRTVRTFATVNGVETLKISPPDLDRKIAGEAFVSSIDTLCYVAGGHPFFQVNGTDWSWVFDVNSQTWHERRSYGSTRSNFTSCVPAFNKWMVGRTDTTDLLAINHTLTQEASEPLIAQIESLPVVDFPNRQRVKRADFNFSVGIGEAAGTDPIETDPTAMIEYSDDGGDNWSVPYYRKLGREDKTLTRLTVNNTGISGPMGRKWRVTVSDPVHFGFIGSTMDPIGLNK